MRSSRPCSSMRTGTGSPASCCCTRTATVSSTCSIATTGALLLARPFVKKLTWAREIGADGRPALNDGQTPTAQGTKVCPSVEGATNWFSTSFSATTGLYYVQALEKCNIFSRSPETWRPGQSYYSGATRAGARTSRGRSSCARSTCAPARSGGKCRKWDAHRPGAGRWRRPAASCSSETTAERSTAVDASDGTALWRFDANADWKASPMTYVFDQRQYIAVAAGPTIIAFALR